MRNALRFAYVLTLSLAAGGRGLAMASSTRVEPGQIAHVVLYGDGQHTAVNQNFAAPLAVSLIGADDQEVLGIVVHIAIESGSARIKLFDHGEVAADGQSATATSNSSESLVAVVTAGAMPGPVVISVAIIGDASQPAQPTDVVGSFTLHVDSPGWPAGRMPDTGRGIVVVVVTASALLALGAMCLQFRNAHITKSF